MTYDCEMAGRTKDKEGPAPFTEQVTRISYSAGAAGVHVLTHEHLRRSLRQCMKAQLATNFLSLRLSMLLERFALLEHTCDSRAPSAIVDSALTLRGDIEFIKQSTEKLQGEVDQLKVE